jgi:predicted phage tail component-like protein
MAVSVLFNGVDLETLGIILTRDTRLDILPERKYEKIEIAGRPGVILIDRNLQPRLLTLSLHIQRDTLEDYELAKRSLVSMLDPDKGPIDIQFSDEPGRHYYGRYNGSIDIREILTYGSLNLPIKMSDPYIYSDWVSIQANGSIEITGESAEWKLEIPGPVTGPSITIGSNILSITGDVISKVIIEEKGYKVSIDEAEGTPRLVGEFPHILKGTTNIASNIPFTFSWRERFEL